MKFKAIILSIVFLFGGSGFSVDIAQCCSSISGISFGLNAHSNTVADDCCARIKPVRKKSCCTDMVIQTVINPVLALHKTAAPVFKASEQILFSYTAPRLQTALPEVQPDAASAAFDHHYPVPILLQKRVLRI